MKLTIMSTIRLFLLVIIPGISIAQDKTDYSVLLNSGKFTPVENINEVSRTQEAFQKSLYTGRYYLILQFKSLPGQGLKDQLRTAGIQLVDYIPNLCFTASIPSDLNIDLLKSFPLRAVFRLNVSQKTVPGLLDGQWPAHAVKIPGYVDVNVITYEKITSSSIASDLGNLQARILMEMPAFRSFTLRVSQSTVAQLADLPFIQWVEFIDPPNEAENLLGRSLHRVNVLNDGVRNLKGDGVNIGIWDENEVSPHLDFSPAGRVNIMEPTGNSSSHSTHCAGTLTGRGLIDHRARGMAPNASLYSYNFSGSIATEMSNAIPIFNLSVSSHSYGGSVSSCSITGSQIAYSSTSRNTDLNLNAFPNHLHVHSSGNSQGSCSGGWYTITGSGKTAKNNLLVANITTAEALSGSSSCGPTADGRVKPEISSFGTSVLSTYTPLNAYGTISGTSMATPGVAGSAVLLVQRYRQLNAGAEPPSALIKNAICNTAADLGNPGPDYRFGFGRINALAAVRLLEENRYSINTVSSGASTDVQVTVPAGASRLKVMLNWNDPAGTANANPALINNLDLSVIDPSATTTLPWVLNPASPGSIATRGVDNVSNIEQVTLDNPPAGLYTLRVNATSVPVGPQTYVVSWSIDQPYIEVTYPNGAESMNPGTTETITWDNAGVSGAQTVEYSLDNGANWSIISNSVPAGTTRLTWSVPSANTSTALIRISSGALTDNSDANFRILGTPTGFTTNASSCAAGEVSFTWGPVAGATHYDMYTLNAGSGEWMILAADIATTNYTATGLTPNASMWFTITAKNTTTGASSPRAYAINTTVSAGGVAAIGNITGQTTICGTPSGISYSVGTVAGATSYTWAAPAGAVIASGQGTNTVLINYPAGSNSGNVSVYAVAGVCQTATATLAVTVGGAAVSAPTSGGDQSEIHCSPNPIPTLTATASVPSGHTLLWYDAASGGNVVASPTLNAIGTITYYAASINNATGCESNARTAVVLTINSAPQTTITASGPLSFCDGGNVVLTATAGSSYAWSNGATTQSITVNASGTFTVTVTQPGGCTSTSSATDVAVNPVPTAAITAGGPVSFCEGNNVVLTASPGDTYSWSSGQTTSAITVNQSGAYTVTVTNASGCSSTSTVTTVTVTPRPVVTVTASPYTRLYPGLNTTLSAAVNPAGTYAYVWMKDGVAVPGASNPSLPVTVNDLGSYSVTVTNAGGCTNTSSLLAIGDSVSRRLFIWPNPNNGLFSVSYHSPAQANPTHTITIYDGKGSYILRNTYNVGSPYQRMEVDLRNMSSGVYHIVLTDRNGKRLAQGSVVLQ